MRQPYSRLLIFAMVMALMLMANTALANDIVVTPTNMNGWTFYTTDSSGTLGTGTGTGQMVNGPATPPLGTGSAHFDLSGGIGDQSVQLRNTDWAGTRIADLTSLGYSTYATAWNGSQLPYLTIWVCLNTACTTTDRLWFEPTYSSAGAGNGDPSPQPDVALNTWQNWNALTGMWYTDSGSPDSNGPGSNAITLAAFLAANPDASIRNAGPGVGGIRIASGFASAGDSFNANVDAFSIGTASSTKTYDFELTAPAAVPEPGSLMLLGSGLLALGGLIRRQRK